MEKIRLSIATTDKLGKPEYQYQHFYLAADVDALLADVRRLVEAARNIGTIVDVYEAQLEIVDEALENEDNIIVSDIIDEIKQAITAIKPLLEDKCGL